MKKNIARRIKRIRTQLRRRRLGGLLVSAPVNVRYLSGFTGDSSVLLVSRGRPLFITDFRYVEQAETECVGCRVIPRGKSMTAEIARQAQRLGLDALGVEAGTLTLESAQALRDELDPITMAPTTDVVEDIRAVKDREEVEAVRKCIAAAEQCIEHVKPFLVPGIREKDIVAELEYHARQLGFDGMAFPTIVAFGPRSSLPHARSGGRRMQRGDVVLIDWGVSGGGYVCDLTRVFFHHKIPARFERVYRTALDAQRRAIRAIRPGVTAGEVDESARRRIRRSRLGKRFGHGLGHGIGLEVHEAPTVGPGSGQVLKRGMVFTVEPGIYLPGLGGVRIEDNVLVTNRGAKVLSQAPKRLRDVMLED